MATQAEYLMQAGRHVESAEMLQKLGRRLQRNWDVAIHQPPGLSMQADRLRDISARISLCRLATTLHMQAARAHEDVARLIRRGEEFETAADEALDLTARAYGMEPEEG